MKSDILFFNPPQTKNGVCLENRILLWLASYLKKNGFNTTLFYLDGKFKETIVRAISYHQPKYIAVSCKWYTNLYGAILVAREIRRIDKTIKIIAGGNTASYFDKELLLNSDFDIVIMGEAELSLLNIMRKKTPINCTVKENGRIKKYKLKYPQGQQEVKDYTLVEPKEILESPKDILGRENFVWTGRGCSQNCFYCSGSAKIYKKMFKRKNMHYRPIRNVLTDIAILSKYSKYLIFDFACPPLADAYYLQLFKLMPERKLSLAFFHWGLPSIKLVDQMSKTFKSALILLDTSTLCEKLREALSRENLLKPFFSNKELENIICVCNNKKNIKLILANIAGLPGEKEYHKREHIKFSQNLIKKYLSIQDITYLPLSIEPGSFLQKNDKKFNMHCVRKSFIDFLNLTSYAFKSNITYPFSDFFGKHDIKIDPYGIYRKNSSSKLSYSRERCFRRIMEEELRVNRVIHNLYIKGAKILKSKKNL